MNNNDNNNNTRLHTHTHTYTHVHTFTQFYHMQKDSSVSAIYNNKKNLKT